MYHILVLVVVRRCLILNAAGYKSSSIWPLCRRDSRGPRGWSRCRDTSRRATTWNLPKIFVDEVCSDLMPKTLNLPTSASKPYFPNDEVLEGHFFRTRDEGWLVLVDLARRHLKGTRSREQVAHAKGERGRWARCRQPSPIIHR